MDFSFSEEQELFRRTVREFALKEVAPKIREYERRREFPWEIYRRMGEVGLIGLRFPKEYGGQDADAVTMGIAVEELAKAGLSIPLADIMGEVLAKHAPESLKARWLPRIVRGEACIGIASTEPGGGSDVAAIKTRAYREGDEYVINGEKQFITGVRECAGFCVLAKTQPELGHRGISMIFVETDRPGVGRYYFDALGWRLFSFGGLTFKDVRVPVGNLVGEEGRGFYQTMETFDLMRIYIAMWCLGLAEAALEESIEYVKQRKAFGMPIGKFEAVQFRIAEGATLLEAARLLCYRALWLMDRGYRITKESAMAKWWVPEVAFKVVNDCLQNKGAAGFTTESLDEFRLREIRGAMIGDGTTDIMKIIIAREILGREFIPYK